MDAVFEAAGAGRHPTSGVHTGRLRGTDAGPFPVRGRQGHDGQYGDRAEGRLGGIMNAGYEGSLRFSVLGPVRAWCGEREVALGSPQQRVVLAALLLRRGRPVTVAELVGAVWGDEPPSAAVSVLRTYASRLRKALEPGRDAGGPYRVIVSAADGYAVRVPERAVDLGVFEQRVAEARGLRAAGEVRAAAELLRAALDGWEGTPLAGLPGPLAEAERSRLAEQRLAVLETRLEVDVELGRHSEVVAELGVLSGEHPLREQLCQLLMLALYRSGRRAEALAAYRRTRGILVAELGIEPGASLQELHHRILTADISLHPPPAEQEAGGGGERDAETGAGVSPAAGHLARPAQLPADLVTFTGREAELQRAEALLPDDGTQPAAVLITAIGGMAGVGKTALAVHWAHRVAHRYPDGQLYINLRGFDPAGSAVPPAEAVRIFLDALGVAPQRIPAAVEAQAALYRSLLATRRMLIVLDNARDSEQVLPLLPGAPGCLVIITSRSRLTGLIENGEACSLALDPLSQLEAYGFLVRRLGAGRLAAEPGAVEEIIACCARLPLALAIAAARAATHPGFPLSAVAEELRDGRGSLDAFVGGDLNTDLRAVFSTSHAAVSVPAARLFRLLGLHAGPDVSAPAAAALAGLPVRETRALLTELTRAHLLIEHVPGRYSLHDLLRVYAAERVRSQESEGERERAVERLLSWHLHTADASYPHLTPRRRRVPIAPPPPGCRPLAFTAYDQALKWCETERPNLVAAVHQAAATGRPDMAWRLTAALWGFFYLRSHLHDWLDIVTISLDAVRGGDDRVGQASSHGDMAAALCSMHRFDEAVVHLRRSMTLWRELGDTRGETRALSNLGHTYLQAGRPGEAVEYCRRALAHHRASGDSWGQGIALANLGDAYQRLDRFDEAVDCLEQALTVLRASSNRWVEGVTLDALGTLQYRLRRRDDAIEYYHQALDAHRDVGNRSGEGETLYHLGDLQLAADDPEAARTSWRQALAILEEFGHPDAEEVRGRLRGPDEREPGAGPHAAAGPEGAPRPTDTTTTRP
ncbi:BTAD domain-containing putative transcriptional regulator [Streptomyces sp. WMMC500]|uniref:AfsR/SARP family transcriptional regulator n=1 Tax=Streptomyces sp. WMMC500 TaxID=3015154 RepID=UPI00248BD90A|nr:BTAD domain-containing putative transcriptional regulator [Streptomyces sp. WMMC500]WBB58517.1 BTAD domain-containing putative transcriptional regulator [Streptomyces sp. WMMC500]